MRPAYVLALCALALMVGYEQCASAQASSNDPTQQRSDDRPEIIAVNANELPLFPYDAGMVRFIASGESTSGAQAVVEVTEMPGYKTAWHQHNNCEEVFYVLEGVLTIKLVDKTYTLPAGSYVFIPRGTPHGQGNFTKNPVRLLTTFTPGGFDQFFRDRVELFKTTKPGDSAFQEKFDELRARHGKWVQILGSWDIDR